MTTPCASTTPGCTSNSSEPAPSCASLTATATEDRRLDALVADPDYARRFTSIAASIQPATPPEGVVERLYDGAEALGAERAVFISFVRNDTGLSSCRFTLACEPSWCREYLAANGTLHDPWLAYAMRQGEPVVASLIAADEGAQRVIALAARHGFRSALLAPVHSGPGHSRSSVLVLGSARAGYFEDCAATGALTLVRIGARMLAAQLHDWWLSRLRQDLVRSARMTAEELDLLRYEHRGWSSKRIAAALDVSKCSVDSRFQRLNIKLGVPNRRSAAQLALECGLIRG